MKNRVATLPKITIEANRVTLSGEETLALSEVLVQQRLSQPSLCELTFYDPASPAQITARLSLGTAFQILINDYPTPIFAGEVTAIEHTYEAMHGRMIRIRGYDVLHRLRKRQSVRAHVQVTPFDLANEMVADLGISVSATYQGPLRQRLIQHRQSDLELLVDFAERCGLYLTLQDDVLHLVTLEGSGDPISLALGESLLEARIEVNSDSACRSVVATGWDPQRIETHLGRASNPRVGRDIAAEAPPDRVGGNSDRSLVNEVTQDTRLAEAFAQAELDFRVGGEVILRGTAEGDPRLRPGTPVDVSGVANDLVGCYVLTMVTHTIDKRTGFVSEFSTEPLALTRSRRNPIATIGIVSQIDDPDNAGRLRVSLPTYNDVETGWMSTLSIGAGTGKGLIASADVGDYVLVLFTDEDPSQGVIIGSLYDINGPPDTGIEAGAVRRYTLLTPGGQRIKLDDTHNIIRIENKDGSYIELGPEKVQVHAATDLEIDAPGRSIKIRGQAIDFERA